MEQYCTDKEIAIKLKKAGFPQNTKMFHGEENPDKIDEMAIAVHLDTISNVKTDKVAAPISEEILKELPDNINYKATLYVLEILKSRNEYKVSYYNYQKGILYDNYKCDNKLSNALAKMYIWLKDNGHI